MPIRNDAPNTPNASHTRSEDHPIPQASDVRSEPAQGGPTRDSMISQNLSSSSHRQVAAQASNINSTAPISGIAPRPAQRENLHPISSKTKNKGKGREIDTEKKIEGGLNNSNSAAANQGRKSDSDTESAVVRRTMQISKRQSDREVAGRDSAEGKQVAESSRMGASRGGQPSSVVLKSPGRASDEKSGVSARFSNNESSSPFSARSEKTDDDLKNIMGLSKFSAKHAQEKKNASSGLSEGRLGKRLQVADAKKVVERKSKTMQEKLNPSEIPKDFYSGNPSHPKARYEPQSLRAHLHHVPGPDVGKKPDTPAVGRYVSNSTRAADRPKSRQSPGFKIKVSYNDMTATERNTVKKERSGKHNRTMDDEVKYSTTEQLYTAVKPDGGVRTAIPMTPQEGIAKIEKELIQDNNRYKIYMAEALQFVPSVVRKELKKLWILVQNRQRQGEIQNSEEESAMERPDEQNSSTPARTSGVKRSRLKAELTDGEDSVKDSKKK